MCKFLNEKNVKIKKKREHAFKCYPSTCNVEILNSFNPGLQVKDKISFSIQRDRKQRKNNV